jgi:sialic acid synthase SpsE
MNYDLFIKNEISTDKLQIPYIIAEAGVNHECDIELAKRLIYEAKEGGADAIKFQTYKADTIASKNSPSYWDTSKESTTSQYSLFKKYDKFWKKEYESLKVICDKNAIEFMSTPFDFESAKFLNDLMNVFKISSSDITNKPFIDFISNLNKPIILSTGASDLSEIKRACDWIEAKNDNKNCLMHCVLNYPTLNSNANLGMIVDLKNKFSNYIIGYSDHTLPEKMKSLEISSFLGAKVVEKHFTHDKSLPGNDHYHAMDKNDLKYFLDNMKLNLELHGDIDKKSLDSELISRQNARRSIVANGVINKGDILTNENITFKRPGTGIPPYQNTMILGKKALRDIADDELIDWTSIKE